MESFVLREMQRRLRSLALCVALALSSEHANQIAGWQQRSDELATLMQIHFRPARFWCLF